jgi:hypothetical protein
MNSAFQDILAANEVDRRDLFLTTANRIGTTLQNIEKDFWVCWTLWALFQELGGQGPRLLFKGGTSLSKAYGLIARFSEDIDITVFRQDIGEAAAVDELEAMGRRPRETKLDAIRNACREYLQGSLRGQLEQIGKTALAAAGQDTSRFTVVPDPDDGDGQSLLIHYPSVAEAVGYIQPSVKIESGAKSALDPHHEKLITPYIADDLPNPGALAVPGVTTIDAERTFLDKVLILHGLTHYFEAKGRLRGNGRMSRHYYDVYRLMAAPVGRAACRDDALIVDCVRHARMFFYRSHTGLEVAARGQFRLQPTAEMLGPLAQDYAAMATMVFGEVPSLDAVLASVADAEAALNVV